MRHYSEPAPPDHFTVPAGPNGAPPDPAAVTDPFRRLVTIMARLRGPGGCPWDREQTHDTLRQYLIEESYEVLDAIAERNDKTLCEELGDVALQVVFHAQLAAEENRFVIDDVYRAICEKLIRRHPHVFGEVQVDGSRGVLANWEKLKEAERAASGKSEKPKGLLSGTPRSLPALQRAARIQEKAARVGFDWATLKPVLSKVREEVEELLGALEESGLDDAANPHLPEKPAGVDVAQATDHVAEELGDLLFALVNMTRFLGIEAEHALQAANDKFARRFHAMHSMMQSEGKEIRTLTLDQMDEYWNRVKRVEREA